MASSEVCSLFLGHGPLIIKRNMAGIPAVAVGSRCRSRSRAGASSLAMPAFPHCPRFLLPVSCKRKDRNPSSRTKRQDAKRVSPDRSPLSENILLNGKEITEVQNATADGISSSQLGTAPSSVVGTSASMHRDAENIEEANGEEQLPSSHLEDLTGMIENTEKNILLLNEARVNALKDLDKILIEKEGLQAEINKLEMKLSEMDTQSKVAAPEEIHPEFLEDHFEKQNNEISSSERMMGNKNNSYERVEIFNSKDSSFDAVDLPSLSEELSALREENASLKGDIRIFMSKISDVRETDECVLLLEEERSMLKSAVTELKSKLATAQEDVSKAATLDLECKDLLGKVENLQMLLDDATRRADQALTLSLKNEELERKVDKLESKLVTAQEDALKLATLDLEYKDLLGKVDNLQMLLDDATKTAVQAVPLSHKNEELERKVDKLQSSLEEANAYKFSLEQAKKYNETLQQKIEVLEVHLQASDQEINSHIELYQASVQEFQETLDSLKEESKRRSLEEAADDLPWEFWSRLLLILDGWLLEKKISIDDANLLREMAWKRDGRIRDAYIACRDKSEHETVGIFLQLTSSQRSSGIHIVHIAAEMAPVAKVGGLGDVVTGLSKSLQKRGHLVEIILPMYDCMHHDLVTDLKELDVALDSYFDGQHFKNKIWVGLVEGLPVYFIEPHHPWKFFWRGQYYGEHDDFKRFSFFSRAALEFLFQSGKKPDIIHCHDWQTAFIPPLYWDVYATKGFNSARICFTCHNFEYQGIASASELTSCGLDVQNLNRPDRLQDNSSHDRINPVKGAIVFSNIVTTVSPSYAQEVRTAEGGRGLHETLNFHSRKFVGILNGIDTDAWNPETDTFLRSQYSVDDLRGKVENKVAIRKHLKLSLANTFQPLVGCITRLVPQKGVHLIRHAIYRTLELGGQFVLLGSSPVPHIQREFEEIANHFENHPHIRLILKYNDALSHNIYAASDMFVIPSMFEPCGLTQMIAMRYGSVPIVRRTGGLNDSVFDVDDDTIPVHLRNGFTFLSPDEQGLSSAMERAFELYVRKPDIWQQLVQKDMRIDFSWDSSSAQYEELYTKAIARARAANQA